MPRILCSYMDCVYLEEGLCGAPKVEFDPESGCLTYRVESIMTNDGWDDDDEIDEEWEDFGYTEEDEEDWLDQAR